MNLTEIYLNLFLEDFFHQIQEEFLLNEAESLDPQLKDLLDQANEIVFDKFQINPENKVYFIAGSAALYLFPQVRAKLDLKGTIGDLDIVIPDDKYWENAGLGGQTIYRPKGNNSIGVFKKWDPSKAGGQYANVKVRDTSKILSKAFFKEGYWFMSLFDILNYKVKLDREKEKEIVNVISKYKEGSIEDRKAFMDDIISRFKTTS